MEKRMAKRMAKPQPVAAPDEDTSGAPSQETVTRDDVARRAYDLYLARGRADGHDVDDWLEAERELRDAERPLVAV
jgi:hypothetical protein